MDQIKQADIDFFKKKLIEKEARQRILDEDCKKMKRIIGDYTETIAQALDLTDESIPITITKRNDTEYEFRRVLPRKLKFKSINDINDFVKITNHTTVLRVCSDGPSVALPGTKITYVTLKHDIDEVCSYMTISLLALSVFGIACAIFCLYDRFSKSAKLREGFEVVLYGTFETLDVVDAMRNHENSENKITNPLLPPPP